MFGISVRRESNRLEKIIEWRKQSNIRQVVLANKEHYYIDLINIEHSWTGRYDGNICNTFVMEAEQLLINAINCLNRAILIALFIRCDLL